VGLRLVLYSWLVNSIISWEEGGGRREEGECLKIEEVDGNKEYGGEECV